MIKTNKATTFQKVMNTLEKIDNTFTVNDIFKKTGIRSEGIKRALKGLEEIGLIKYIESNKLYIKINNVNNNQSNNITNLEFQNSGVLKSDN